jgi:hypothetical protein
VTHVLLLNLVFFVPAACGATASALYLYRFLKNNAPPEARPPDGGSKLPLPSAGPQDLARSA